LAPRLEFSVDPAEDGPFNMATDLAMLEGVRGGTLAARLYEWSGPWVTVGRFQDSAAFSERLWVRRPTGGRAVFHGEDWTVAMVAELALIGAGPKQLRLAYRSLTTPIAEALRQCGANVTLAERTHHVTPTKSPSGDCFATTAPVDLVGASGEKACGVALRMTDTAILLQASIPKVGWNAERFPSAFREALENFVERLQSK
jgi:lipoate-protein ligase A